MIVYRQFQDFLLDGLFVLRTDVKIIQIYGIIVANLHSGPMVQLVEHLRKDLIATHRLDCPGVITVNDFSPTLFQYITYSKFGLDSFGRNRKEQQYISPLGQYLCFVLALKSNTALKLECFSWGFRKSSCLRSLSSSSLWSKTKVRF